MFEIGNEAFITTDRLLLEKPGENHCTPAYLSWLHDDEVNKYLLSGSFPTTIDDLKAYVKAASEKKNTLFLAIISKENRKHIGNIKIENIDFRNGLAEYGIMMGDKSEWKKGYAKEATVALIDHCFKKLNIRKLMLGVVAVNSHAVALYKNIGFQEEGYFKKHMFYNGEYQDSIKMAIFQDYWLENHG